MLIYSTYLGGNGLDNGSGLALDSAGNAYVTGYTTSTNFPVLNAFQSTFSGAYGGNAFVTKLTADGAGLWYSTYLGGSSNSPGDNGDYGTGIVVDSAGNAYVTGYTDSPNFPTKNPIQSANHGGLDAFVTKLNSVGNGLIYSTYLGGNTNEAAYSIAVDAKGAAYITGFTTSLDFPTTAGVVQPHMATNGTQNTFITKLNPAGSALAYSTYLGGGNAAVAPHQSAGAPGQLSRHTIFSGCDCGEYAHGIAVDASGDAYITGQSNTSNFPTTPGAFQMSAPAGYHVFVSKLNPSASALVYSTYVAGSGGEDAEAIALDSTGNAYITGYTSSPDYPTVNPLQGTIGNASGDTFVTQLNASGSALLYSSYLDGSTNLGSIGYGVALNSGRDVYVVGYTSATNFPIKNAFQSTFAGGNSDAFVTKMRLWPSVDTTTGVFRPSNGALYLKNANSTGPADLTLYYGQPGDQPITGDWTGKGYQSIGIYRNGTFYLRNSNTTGYADLVVPFGAATDLPVAGDWTGKGYDSIGVYRPSNSTFYLRDSNTSGPPDHVVTLGITGDDPIVGDWTGKGYDSIGVFRPSNGIVYLRNSNTTGYADISFIYGKAGDKPVVGDWNADGVDTIGVDRAGRFLLRNSNSTGPADFSFYLGAATDQPIAGVWLAPPGSLPSHRPAAPQREPSRPAPGVVDRSRQLQ